MPDTRQQTSSPSKRSWQLGPTSLLMGAILTAIPCISGAGTIRFSVEEPKPDSTYSGVQNLRGWAISSVGISKVELYIDGKYIADIPSGGLRRDVGNTYPDYPNSEKSGYSMAYSYTNLSPGQHSISIKVIDNDGDTRERSINFNVTRFDGGFIRDAQDIDATNATITSTNDSIRIEGLMAKGIAHDVTLRWNPTSQGLSFSQISTSGNTGGGGGNNTQCVTVPFPAAHSVIEWDISGSTSNGDISGTINTEYLSVSDTTAKTDTVSTISGAGVTTTTTTTTTQNYYIDNDLLYMEKIVVTGTASVSGYTTNVDSTLTNNPAMLMGPAKKYCINQTWSSPPVSQTITTQGTTTTDNSIGFTGKVESINESMTTPAGTFTVVRVRTTRDDGSEGIIWTAISNGLMIRQEEVSASGDTQVAVATRIN